MKKTLKLTLVVIGMPAVSFLFFAIYFLNHGIFGECGVEVMAERTTLDGRYRARLIEENCGATTPIYTHVKVADLLSGGTSSVLILEDRRKLPIDWVSDRLLAIALPDHSSLQTDKKLDHWNGIDIRYVQNY